MRTHPSSHHRRLDHSTHSNDRLTRAACPAFPFFEFMLYGAKSFAGGGPGAEPATVTRGRSLTLLPLTAGPAPRPAPSATRAC